jgi:hypothetical protein
MEIINRIKAAKDRSYFTVKCTRFRAISNEKIMSKPHPQTWNKNWSFSKMLNAIWWKNIKALEYE